MLYNARVVCRNANRQKPTDRQNFVFVLWFLRRIPIPSRAVSAVYNYYYGATTAFTPNGHTIFFYCTTQSDIRFNLSSTECESQSMSYVYLLYNVLYECDVCLRFFFIVWDAKRRYVFYSRKTFNELNILRRYRHGVYVNLIIKLNTLIPNVTSQ